jgi:hypothetical protein
MPEKPITQIEIDAKGAMAKGTQACRNLAKKRSYGAL